MRKSIITSLIALLSVPTFATTIAIVDSGTDMQHDLIAPKAWINSAEIPNNNRDEDRNGYQDDIYGWNFAEGNNQVIDYSYLGTLNDDIRQFFMIQAKAMRGEATQEELTWMRTIVQDQEFIKRITVYGNFMHGTHVAGISARMSEAAKILAIKLIPTEVKLPGQELTKLQLQDKNLIEKLVKAGIDMVANQQMTQLEEISFYLGDHGARVMNGSFGTGYPQAKMIVETVYKAITRGEPDAAQVEKYAKYFISSLITNGKKIVDAAPKTLFVYAAGNDGLNNDEFGTSPANIKADNVLAVAATIDQVSIAPFSNYGKSMVEVAAPGVGINSAAPGNNYIEVSGTSQAAPFVAGVAGKVLDTNPELSPKEVKTILMGTVDKKSFLADAVKSSGIVNTDRAVRAALLSKSVSLGDAISQSRIDIADVQVENKNFVVKSQYVKGSILPLPSLLKIK